jgi:uncharacterized protein YwgA
MTDISILGSLLKRIGNYDKMESFEGRLKLQKTIYLMQAFDLYIGYNFSWYIRGPYSTQLAKDGFALREVYNVIPSGRFTDLKAEQRFASFLQFIDRYRNDADWLEIVASIHFLTKVYSNLQRDRILSIVKNKQPYFVVKQCQDAWNYLKKWKMI